MGNIEVRRLPVLFGDSIARTILLSKEAEARDLIEGGQISLASVISSYQQNTFLSPTESKARALYIAERFLQAGYDLGVCEQGDQSTTRLLIDWGVYDQEVGEFLSKHRRGDQTDCAER